MSKTITIQNNQSLLDIAIQEYGNVQAVIDLMTTNNVACTQLLVVGDVYEVPDSDYTNIEIKAYYDKKNIKPATGYNFIPATTLFEAGLFAPGLFE